MNSPSYSSSGSQPEPLSVLRFPPHGPRDARRAPKPRLGAHIIRLGIVVSLAALFAVYTGLARGAFALAVLALTLALGLWLTTMAGSSASAKRHLKT